MREILFRGKRVENGEWVYGDYCGICRVECNDGDFVYRHLMHRSNVEPLYMVDPETVGQYTGLTDKNGKKICEGDIMAFCKRATRPFEIRWDGIGWKMFCADGTRIKDPFESWEIWHMQRSEVIGNKWDNPELLEVEE